MIDRIVWVVFRVVRGATLPHLTDADRAESDELIAARLLAARKRGRGAARIWAREFADIVRVRLSRWSATSLPFSMLDVKVGLRLLVKQPGLTAVALITLMIGIPVGLAPLHAIRAFQAPPPVDEGTRLQVVKNFDLVSRDWTPSFLYDFLNWRHNLTAFETLVAAASGTYNVIALDDDALPVRGAAVTASVFATLRVPPLMGRALVTADEAPGAPAVVVIARDLWRARLGGDPGIVGRSIRISGVAHTVVGVMPDGFVFPVRERLWLPLRVNPLAEPGHGQSILVFGRLADGLSPVAAQAQVAALGERTAAEFPDTHARLRPEVVPYTIGLFPLPRAGLQSDVGFYFIQATAVFVLIVICTNIAMLMLARTAARSEELAVRTALGASRVRILVQLFTESAVLALGAAAAGLLIADQIAGRAFGWLLEQVPGWIDFGVTTETSVLALGLAALSAAVLGVLPAFKVTGKDIRWNISSAAAGRAGVRFGGLSSTLIVIDVALAVATVGLAVGAWDTERGGGLGIDAGQYLSAGFRVPGAAPGTDVSAFDPADLSLRVGATQQALARRLEAEPGIGRAAFASVLPGMDHPRRWIEMDGEDTTDGFRGHRVRVAQADIDFFDALEQPILRGRGFDLTDLDDGMATVIVNTSFVDRVLAGRNPIGRWLRYRNRPGQEPGPWYEIVGVVGKLGMDQDDPESGAGVYHPLPPGAINPVRFAVKVGNDPGAFAPRLEALLGEVDPTAILAPPLPLADVFSFDAYVNSWLTLGVFAFILAVLILSSMGIYALMSFSVAQRTREIGIRIAMGARGSHVAFTIARRALTQMGLGLALGMTLSAVLLTAIDASIARVVAALGAAACVLLVIGLCACVAPTLRALRILPTEALRSV